MNRATVMKVVIIVALVIVAIIGYRMLSGNSATLPTPPKP